MTIYLTAQQVLFIHARLIDATGGEQQSPDLKPLSTAQACRPAGLIKPLRSWNNWHRIIPLSTATSARPSRRAPCSSAKTAAGCKPPTKSWKG
jgi:hypothetical protein